MWRAYLLTSIKKVTRVFEREVLTRRALREVVLMRHLESCENITQLLDLDTSFIEFSEIYLYLSASDADLHQIFRSGQELSEGHIRYFMVQLLRAVNAMHQSCILHRDLKPGNLLVNSDCKLRVCDFGLARPFKYADKEPCNGNKRVKDDWPAENGRVCSESPDEQPRPSMPRADNNEALSTIRITPTHSVMTDTTPNEAAKKGWPERDEDRSKEHERVIYPGGPLTEYVSTRWYRAPEVMLCFEDGYGPPMDMWSVGCIFAELLAGKPLCAGKDFMDQLVRIHNLLGTAPPEVVERIGSNRAKIHVQLLPPSSGVSWSKLFPEIPPGALDLLSRLLRWVPEERITARDALMHPWLSGFRTQSMSQPCPEPFNRFDLVELIRTPSAFAKAFESEAALLHGVGDWHIETDSAPTPSDIVEKTHTKVDGDKDMVHTDSDSDDASAAQTPSPRRAAAHETLKRKASDVTLFERARQLMGWI